MAKVPNWVAGKSRWDSMPLESSLQFPPYWVTGSTAALDVGPRTRVLRKKIYQINEMRNTLTVRLVQRTNEAAMDPNSAGPPCLRGAENPAALPPVATSSA